MDRRSVLETPHESADRDIEHFVNSPTLQIDNLRLHCLSSRLEMAGHAVQRIANRLRQALDSQENARVILASAPSQDEMLAALTNAELDWARVTIFHMDEYLGLSSVHPASFGHYQRMHVLNRITPGEFHPIDGETSEPAKECERYTGLLVERPIDLVCLGIGENGHLAFNDPPTADFSDPAWVKVVELDPACRQQQVNDGCFAALEDVPRQAITLTIPALMSARAVVAVVPGPRKAAAVRAALEGEISPACPASILRRHGNADLYLDAAAASLLVQP
ncbi:MAG: glucosamine-6-phosphate deaminase [Chthoniobacteraceae bacterium]